MALKVKLLPSTQSMRPDNGIGRVLYAQIKYLPEFGIDLVEGDADLYVGHTQQFTMPRIDVLHVHGMYWLGDKDSGKYGAYHVGANASIISAARRARAITVPSEWVAVPFKRDMRISPQVIGHGIDFADWQQGKPQGYVLWAKNRPIDVCYPDAPLELARRGVNVVTTFAPEGVKLPDNLQVIGRQEPDAMREYLMGASLYLATTKETFGIQTVEAMACGVPVVGWNYGGTAEIVTHGHDGLLVKPGDYDALTMAIKEAMLRRDELGRNARATASGYDWRDVIKRYADLYQQTHDEAQTEPHGVSVVITNHNYGRYVGEAISSVLAQTQAAAEVIVVDDGSTDDSLDVLAAYPQVKVITQDNQGVAQARTTGISAATQPYIVCLDADDKLAPEFIATLQPAIDADRGLGIVYSGLTLFDDHGNPRPSDYPPAFDWENQATVSNPPANCIPSACLFRREMWLRAGPHKQEYAPGEDAEFWTRGLAVGFDAQKVTAAGLLWYRLHGDSASRRLRYRAIDDRLPWMRDKRYPLAAPSKRIALIMSYSEPKISVIVNVTAATADQLADTVDSVLGQTMREWEMVIVDRCGDFRAWQIAKRYPFVEHVTLSKTSNKWLDAGLRVASSPLVLFIDAGEMLTNSALEEMSKAHVNSGGRYVFTDILLLQSGKIETLITPDYKQAVWTYPLHHHAALIPTDWAGKVRDSADYDEMYSRLAQGGYCGQHLGRALIITRHEAKPSKSKRLTKLGGKAMSKCCGGNGDAILSAKAALSGMVIDVLPKGTARLEYTGDRVGSISFFGKGGREYRGGNNDEDRYITAHADDVERLVNSGQWRIVQAGIVDDTEPEPQPAPVVEAVAEAVPAATSAYDLPEPMEDEAKPTHAEVKANAAIVTKVRKGRRS